MKRKVILGVIFVLIIIAIVTAVIIVRSKEKIGEVANDEVIADVEMEGIEQIEGVTEELTEEVKIEETPEVIQEPVVEEKQVEQTKKQTTTQAQTNSNKSKTQTSETKSFTSSSAVIPEPETPKQETKTEEKTVQEPVVVRCTTNSNHSLGVGNCGKWYSSKAEGVADYTSRSVKCGEDLDSGKITWEEYIAKCPAGYECYTCMYCNKWTLNYF